MLMLLLRAGRREVCGWTRQQARRWNANADRVQVINTRRSHQSFIDHAVMRYCTCYDARTLPALLSRSMPLALGSQCQSLVLARMPVLPAASAHAALLSAISTCNFFCSPPPPPPFHFSSLLFLFLLLILLRLHHSSPIMSTITHTPSPRRSWPARRKGV
ncbi:hypothetical protein CERZMDRAFT_88116 [Cercospora zeae-maydis SCOH1-5]|uniref:Uncharacterized protein n=1 Tax=Cercospora zeae-maydis SCOH1-5 TaxID=717836 RepID=A0A6A6F3X1_9PEZI|nr:hypothetical protein CERZMDRAFT_88116 [Cercospora zeae-maydis SCOH1-5]